MAFFMTNFDEKPVSSGCDRIELNQKGEAFKDWQNCQNFAFLEGSKVYFLFVEENSYK